MLLVHQKDTQTINWGNGIKLKKIMRKQDLINKIKEINLDQLNPAYKFYNEHRFSANYGRDVGLDLGEYFFDTLKKDEETGEYYENIFFLEDMELDFSEYFKVEKDPNDLADDFILHTWSSKSGTSAAIKLRYSLEEDESISEAEYIIEEHTSEFDIEVTNIVKHPKDYFYYPVWNEEGLNQLPVRVLKPLYKEIKGIKDRYTKEAEQLKELYEAGREWIEGYAAGVKTGSFSNGEAIFDSIPKNEEQQSVTFAGKWTEPYYESL